MWLILREIIFLFKIEQDKCLKYYFVQLVNFNFSSNGLKKCKENSLTINYKRKNIYAYWLFCFA